MKILFKLVLLCHITFVVFILINRGEASEGCEQSRHRPRRYLAFRNVTHFFLRLNFKANMVPWNQIFAQALGFRMNWDDPPDSFHPYRHLRLRRHTLYNNLELLFDKNGLDGFHCVRRAVCETEDIGQPDGIYHKILKIIFRRSSSTEKWHNTTEEECQISSVFCPISLLNVLPYTDL